MAAAVLHLQHGPRPAKAGNFKWRKRGVGVGRVRESVGDGFRPGQQTAFGFLHNDGVGGVPARGGLSGHKARRAAGQQHARAGSVAAHPEERVARVPLPAGRDGAGIDADDIGRVGAVAFRAALRRPGFAQGLRFVLIDFTAEGDKVKFPGTHALGVRKWAALDK